MTSLTYPSQVAGMLGPPEPMLLDTCVIQNIEWVWARMEEPEGGQWTEERVAELEARFGADLTEELLCLGYLVDHFQYEGGFPWLASSSTRAEIERFAGPGEKPVRISQGWIRLAEAQDEWAPDSFGSTAPAFLDASRQVHPNPLILRGLGVGGVEEIMADSGPLSAFPHQGDRALIRDALLSGVPAILTTDLRSFWAHREKLYDFGLEVWRPSDALTAYEPRWAPEREMLARRRAEHDGRRESDRAAATPARAPVPPSVRSTGST